MVRGRRKGNLSATQQPIQPKNSMFRTIRQKLKQRNTGKRRTSLNSVPPPSIVGIKDPQGKLQTEFDLLFIEACKKEYERLIDTWTVLDTKAQTCATIAGIFIGGLISLFSGKETSLGLTERYLIGIAVVSLMTSVGSAAGVLFLRDIPTPVTVSRLVEMYKDTFRQLSPDEAAVTLQLIKNQQITNWAWINRDLEKKLRPKIRLLGFAQSMLLSAILLAGSELILKIVIT